MAADICRLCLRPIDKAKSIDLVAETTKFAMLKELLPEMNLDITENTQVCSNCMQELEVSYNFKQSVVVNEANIQTKLEENKLKKIDLKLMLDDVAKKELKEDDYVCRTCLLICRTPSIHLFDTPSNMMPCSFVKKMCQLVFELEFIASDKPVLCDECWETLQTVYNFRKCCLKTDKKLRTYVAKKNLKKLGVEEFKKFVEENPPIDNDEVSSDDELDGYIKEEPIDEEELKFDPEEASCSSASLKFKEETTVKSESDEDMEDEPELLDPKALKSETSELDGEDCKMEIGDVKVDAEGEGAAGPSGRGSTETLTSTGQYPLKTAHKLVLRPHQKTQKRNSKRKMFACAQCSKVYVYKQGLSRHIFRVHNRLGETKRFSCSLCSFKTIQKVNIQNHLEIRKPKSERPLSVCVECSLKEYTRKYVLDHMRRVHQKPIESKRFSCLHCSYNASQKRFLRRHLEIHKPNCERPRFTCTQCPKIYMNKQSVSNHIGLVHKPAVKMKTFSCTHCAYKTVAKRDLGRHLEIHKTNSERQMFACAHCSNKYKAKKTLSDHIFRVHKSAVKLKTFSCLNCAYKTSEKRDFRYHLETHKLNAERPPFACAECLKEYTRKYVLLDHIRRVHQKPIESKRFSCLHCPYKASQKRFLRRHLAIHKPNCERPRFTCTQCSKRYMNIQSLSNHISLVHNTAGKMKTFSCTHCAYNTLVKRNLRSHLEIHKPNYERPRFTCTQCSKRYMNIQSLSNHINLVHNTAGKIKTFSCTHCAYKTLVKRNLRSHLEIHKLNCERPRFTCTQCPKSYMNKQSLSYHVSLVHNTAVKMKKF